MKGGVKISKNETEMAQWLLQNGPISNAINANAMQFYMGGISHPWKFLCSATGLDHGVLIVGFGIHHYPMFKRDMPYWIVKNSWGPSWGEKGTLGPNYQKILYKIFILGIESHQNFQFCVLKIIKFFKNVT